jgi:DNA-directed RNA polymerase
MKVPDKFKYSKTKQVRAFMPNLIHSLDADALALLVDYYFSDTSSNTKNIYTIHDCFAVTANNVENLIGFLKLVYYKIYSENNYLREVDREIRHHIKLHLKDDFDENKLEVIKTERETSGKIRRKILKYPSINDVLGMNSNAEGLILDSAYLVH